MIDFDYTAPEMLFHRVAEVRAYPDKPHKIGGIVYEQARGECEWEITHDGPLFYKSTCKACGFEFRQPKCVQGYEDLDPNFCPSCGEKVKR